MKELNESRIRHSITVSGTNKTLALIMSLLDAMWFAAEREKIIRALVSWYRVTL